MAEYIVRITTHPTKDGKLREPMTQYLHTRTFFGQEMTLTTPFRSEADVFPTKRLAKLTAIEYVDGRADQTYEILELGEEREDD